MIWQHASRVNCQSCDDALFDATLKFPRISTPLLQELSMHPLPIARIILYVRDLSKVAAFYEKHFGLKPLAGAEDGWLEIGSPSGGCSIALHRAATSQKRGSEIKIVFGVKDVRKFKAEREAAGLKFGVIHKTSGHEFSNAKDPAGNSIQISSRGLG
jgi:predicted enzyme related to lactoylglutathione lyase